MQLNKPFGVSMTKELSRILGDHKGYTNDCTVPLTTSTMAKSVDSGLRQI